MWLFAVQTDALVAYEVGQARDVVSGGHLNVTQARALKTALDAPCHLITAGALMDARTDLDRALQRLDLDALRAAGRCVSIFLWEQERDG